MGFSRQEYWSGCHFLFQGIFLTQGLNPHLLWFLHWQADSLPTVPRLEDMGLVPGAQRMPESDSSGGFKSHTFRIVPSLEPARKMVHYRHAWFADLF